MIWGCCYKMRKPFAGGENREPKRQVRSQSRKAVTNCPDVKLSLSIRDGPGPGAGPMDLVALYDADQSSPRLSSARWQGADRVGIGKLPAKHQLPGCSLGPAGGNRHHAACRLGHVLQRHGGPARRPPFHFQWHLAI